MATQRSNADWMGSLLPVLSALPLSTLAIPGNRRPNRPCLPLRPSFEGGYTPDGAQPASHKYETCLANFFQQRALPSREYLPDVLRPVERAGSHDSFSYWVDEKSPVGPDQVIAIRRIAKIPLVKKLMKKWSITQNLTFKEQLDSGIRYFDLRVSSKPGEAGQEIYFIHGLFGTTVCDGLVEINNFLTRHPKEVIFLDFNHFYAMDMNHHVYLISKIEEIFGSKLCTKECVENVTLQSLWEKQQQVLVFYHHSICEIYPVLWAGNKMPAPWANTTNVHKLLQFLETTLKERAKYGTFHVSQAILTPRVKTFAWHLSRGLKNTLVHRNLPFILNWVKLQKPGIMGVNIITSDFVEQVDFAATIIGLNNLLLEV